MEALSHQLFLEANKPILGLGVKICPRYSTIPDLFFADDYLQFCRTIATSSGNLKALLNLFCSTFGQLINLCKSVLTFSRNASVTQKRLVIAIFDIHKRDSLGKYLGCLVFQGCPIKTTFPQVIIKACSKLDG